MSLSVSFTLTGDKELDRKFQELPKRVEKKILREALRPAAKMIQRQAVSNFPERTGTARQSLKVRAGKRSRRTPDQVSIVVITAAGWFKGPAFYVPFVELGHKFGKRSLPNRRQIPGIHAIKKALDQQGETAKQDAIKRIAEGIEREAAALAG